MLDAVSIILPAYNEEANISEAVHEIKDFMDRHPWRYEIIVVDDGSADGTYMVSSEMAERYEQVRVVRHERNMGYGASLRDGFNSAIYDLVFFTDSDRQFRIESIGAMMTLIQEADIVIGYRQHRKDPFMRRFLSWAYNQLVGLIFDLEVKDIDCAFKLFRKEIFKSINIESDKFFVNTEILAKARNLDLRIVETGVPHFPRLSGKSTVSMKYIPLTIRELIRIHRRIKNIRHESTSD